MKKNEEEILRLACISKPQFDHWAEPGRFTLRLLSLLSQTLGEPIDRMLVSAKFDGWDTLYIREAVWLPDMHDYLKKIDYRIPAKKKEVIIVLNKDGKLVLGLF